MPPRMLALLGLFSLTISPACDADDPKTPPVAIKQIVREAIEAEGQGNLPKAIGLLEKALESAPDDRQALFALGALSLNGAEEEKDPARKAALFRKAGKTLRHLAETQKELKSTESAFIARSRLGEIRADALAGHPEAALVGLRKAISEGFDDFEMLEEEPDLTLVRVLPDYPPLITAGLKQVVEKEFKAAQPFPFTFALKDLNEKAVTSGDFKGKVTIVDLWGTWCPPCRKEVPHFVELDREYRPKGLAIVGINCNESGTRDEIKATIQKFLAENKVEYPCLLDDDHSQDKVPGFQGYPTTLFLDRTGRVRLSLVGYTSKSKLEVIVKTLLDEVARP